MLWDIFCKVIDNHGDIGVCWRLSVQLAGRGHAVRLWVDDASALQWMAPGGYKGVEVKSWSPQATPPDEPGDAVVEAFGCELDAAFQAAIAAKARRQGSQPVWINLEYLTAESFARRNHRLPSPILSGPASGLTKHFFYPGFTEGTGGLLREADLLDRQAIFDGAQWLQAQGIADDDAQKVSLFCYEPPALAQLLTQWAAAPHRTHLLVTQGRAAAAVRAAIESNERTLSGWNARSRLAITFLPLLPQREYDHLLWSCDLNFVRGEDSLVRALWAGKPFVWNIYPQDDDAHHAKLTAFLDWLGAPGSLRVFHGVWNGAIAGPLPEADAQDWAGCVRAARQRLLAQHDLATQLLAFTASQSAST
jgi:uncharacterized repeat protein (TIGR03837 family)